MIGSIIISVGVVVVYVIAFFFMNDPCSETDFSDMLGYLAPIVAGVFTLLGVAFTIYEQKRSQREAIEKEEQLQLRMYRYQIMPKVECGIKSLSVSGDEKCTSIGTVYLGYSGMIPCDGGEARDTGIHKVQVKLLDGAVAERISLLVFDDDSFDAYSSFIIVDRLSSNNDCACSCIDLKIKETGEFPSALHAVLRFSDRLGNEYWQSYSVGVQRLNGDESQDDYSSVLSCTPVSRVYYAQDVSEDDLKWYLRELADEQDLSRVKMDAASIQYKMWRRHYDDFDQACMLVGNKMMESSTEIPEKVAPVFGSKLSGGDYGGPTVTHFRERNGRFYYELELATSFTSPSNEFRRITVFWAARYSTTRDLSEGARLLGMRVVRVEPKVDLVKRLKVQCALKKAVPSTPLMIVRSIGFYLARDC